MEIAIHAAGGTIETLVAAGVVIVAAALATLVILESARVVHAALLLIVGVVLGFARPAHHYLGLLALGLAGYQLLNGTIYFFHRHFVRRHLSLDVQQHSG